MDFNDESQQKWHIAKPSQMKDEPFICMPVSHIDHLFAAIKACEKRNISWLAYTHNWGWYLSFHALETSEEVEKIAKGEGSI